MIDLQKAKRDWDREGFVILKGFFAEQSLALVEKVTREAWSTRSANVVVDDLDTGRRALIRDLSAEERRHRFKTNDLYLALPEVRELALQPELTQLLSTLLEERVVLCNSLSFDYGSGQPEHIDSLYMTPRTPGKLLAIWVAMEDVVPEAGPLFYFPQSHKLPRFTFSDGTFHAIDAEMPRWHAHIRQHLKASGMKAQQFMAKRGDVFVWSSDIVHGGTTASEPSRSRKSIVFHYFAQSDFSAQADSLCELNGGFWLRRPRQPVPEDTVPSTDRGAGATVSGNDVGASPGVARAAQANGSLRDALRQRAGKAARGAARAVLTIALKQLDKYDK